MQRPLRRRLSARRSHSGTHDRGASHADIPLIRRTLEALEHRGARPCLLGLDADGRTAWSQSGEELLTCAGGWQQELRTRGAAAGDRVGLELPRGPQLLAAHLGALASGLTIVPINPSLSETERERVIACADLAALVEAGASGAAACSPQLQQRDDARPALLIFTSGTTGEPKGVPLNSANLEANLEALSSVWELTQEDRLLHVLPCHHLHGLVLALYGMARVGGTIVMLERFDAERCLQSLEAQSITVFMGVPTMYHRMLRASTAASLEKMRLFVSGSAPLAASDFRDFEARFGHAPVERYGLTETMIVTSNPLKGERRPGWVGRPLPETDVRLAKDGEIEVRGPAVMSGYWRDEHASAAAFDDGFFRTGDLGECDPDGTLRIAGRKKELIIVGGTNVLPGEVEAVLAEDPDVEEVGVVGMPDPDRGEVVAAFVVARAGAELEALKARLSERAERGLASYKRPRSYQFLDSLPRNAMGKLDRRSLTGGS